MGAAWQVFALVVVVVVVIGLAYDLFRRESSLLERASLVFAVAAGVIKGGDTGSSALPLALLGVAAVTYAIGRARRESRRSAASA